MITIWGDFNDLDGSGRLVLCGCDLVIHEQTPFEAIASSGRPIHFVQGEDIVQGRLVRDPVRGWCGEVDWDTQDVLQEYPRPSLVRAG
jgi:hypothetical protein